MEPHRVGAPLYIADANVLIDFLNADLKVLGLVSEFIGPVLVLRVILRDEVDGLTLAGCAKAGLQVVDSSVETLIQAARHESTGRLLSFYDWLVLLEAKERGGACLTNDGALIKACRSHGIDAVRGLAPLLQLVSLGKFRKKEALELVEKMAAKNSYLRKVVPEFVKKLGALPK
ncbi:MAG: hypothetical protein Q8N23_27865 [Archangium sp.]|nr:hypothetical protein [Archangium sp.]MDP3573863.1 hypothetical protein [Archangium sp.]